MRKRPYYSVRTAKHPTSGRLDLAGLKHQLAATFQQFENDRYFQEAFGFECVDAGFIAGSAGDEVEVFFHRKLKKQDLWPLPSKIDRYSEDDLFDVIELLHDCVSKGVEGPRHSYDYDYYCWHVETFDRLAGQSDFREKVNEILPDYDCGYQLTRDGEIFVIAPTGLADLEDARVPGDPRNVQQRVEAAVDKFRRRRQAFEERADAVKDLVQVLEYLRPRAKEVLNKKDEADLFELANKFGIRHHNQWQKTDYDEAIWLSWMFYYYLATIHALTRLIEKADKTA